MNNSCPVREHDGISPLKARVWKDPGLIWSWRAERPFMPRNGGGVILFRAELFTTWRAALHWALKVDQ